MKYFNTLWNRKFLNNQISILNINTKDMSKYIVFHASHISRIKNGKTKPSGPKEFSTKVANYIVYKYNSPIYKDLLLTVLDSTEDDINNDDKLFHKIYDYLVSNYHTKNKNYINDFLTNLDKFDLYDYIKTIKFDELKVPSLPFYIVKSKNYYGIEEMKKGELDFFKATVLSKSMEDVFMCSDMPMEEFLDDSIALSTENIFYDKKIKYTYEDFIKHFELTIQYSNINKNYKVITNSYKTFKNINITMVRKHHVILSKSANPIIHFVIKHPKLVDAIVNFNPLVIE